MAELRNVIRKENGGTGSSRGLVPRIVFVVADATQVIHVAGIAPDHAIPLFFELGGLS